MSESNNLLSFWRRLEPHAREEGDFSRGIEARIYDPAWMLARQWQLGEFEGEDAGSPISVSISAKEDKISKVMTSDGKRSVVYNEEIPLEVYVEPMDLDVPTRNNDGSLSFDLDLETRVKIGLQFEYEINAVLGVLSSSKEAIGFLKFLSSPTQNSPSLSFDNLNERQDEIEMDTTKRYLQMVRGRVIDIYKIINRPNGLEILKNKASKYFGPLPAGLSVLVINALQPAFDNLKQWWKGADAGSNITSGSTLQRPEDPFFVIPAYRNDGADSTSGTGNKTTINDKTAWDPKSLDYNFAVQIGLSDANRILLDAHEYKEEYLDWYSFSIGSDTFSWPQRSKKDVIPTNLKFAGMPEKRWWNFEDSFINFGSIAPKTNNLVTMLLMEFCLIQSPNWYIIPYPMRVGTISQIEQIKVKDVFGDETLIKQAGKTDREISSLQGAKSVDVWNMFTLSKSQESMPSYSGPSLPSYFFLPPVADSEISGGRVEEISLIRDEIANLVWAIEKRYRTYLGEAISSYDHHVYLQNKKAIAEKDSKASTASHIPIPNLDQGQKENQSSSSSVNFKEPFRYSLINTVPPNWIPFIPVNINDIFRSNDSNSDPLKVQIALQRAAIIDPVLNSHPENSGAIRVILPNSRILREVPSPYFIDESEIPGVGSILSEKHCRVVWSNGRIFLWLRRQKQAGSGEGRSGLRFDHIPINSTV